MNKITKLVYFSLLAMIALSRLLIGEWALAIALLCLLIFSIPFFDVRENKRQFYRGMRKLYVCVDFQGFISARDALSKNALFIKTIVVPESLLNAIEAYYQGNLEESRNLLVGIQANGDYLFWKTVYLIMVEQRLSIQKTNVATVEEAAILIRKVPKHFKVLAMGRLELLKLIISGTTIEQLEALRENLTCNLLIAEATDMIATLHQDERLKAYYYKAALNISRGLKLS